MTQFELLRDRGILVVTFHGPLEKATFEQLANEIYQLIASKGKLAGVMLCADTFPGWENFAAFVSHIRFVADHHRQIERVAVVSDSTLLKVLPHIASLFVQAKVRHFEPRERDQALAWLESGR